MAPITIKPGGITMPGIRGLFIPGPTNMPDEVRLAMDIPMEDQRAPDFPDFTLPLFEDVKKVFKIGHRPGLPVPVLRHRRLGSGDHQHAVARRQGAGRALRPVLPSVDRPVPAPRPRCRSGRCAVGRRRAGRRLRRPPRRPTASQASRRCWSATTRPRPASPAMWRVRKVLDAHSHPALLFVDGVSSIASIEFRMDEWGVDVAVAGSQKGFMMPTGLASCASARRRSRPRRRQELTAASSISTT